MTRILIQKFITLRPNLKKREKNKSKITPITKQPSLWALSPLLVFLCLYLVVSLIVNDFYKVPITVAFLVSSVYAVCITSGLSLNDRLMQYSQVAADQNIFLMIWIFVFAGAWLFRASKYPLKKKDAVYTAPNISIIQKSFPKIKCYYQ